MTKMSARRSPCCRSADSAPSLPTTSKPSSESPWRSRRRRSWSSSTTCTSGGHRPQYRLRCPHADRHGACVRGHAVSRAAGDRSERSVERPAATTATQRDRAELGEVAPRDGGMGRRRIEDAGQQLDEHPGDARGSDAAEYHAACGDEGRSRSTRIRRAGASALRARGRSRTCGGGRPGRARAAGRWPPR